MRGVLARASHILRGTTARTTEASATRFSASGWPKHVETKRGNPPAARGTADGLNERAPRRCGRCGGHNDSSAVASIATVHPCGRGRVCATGSPPSGTPVASVGPLGTVDGAECSVEGRLTGLSQRTAGLARQATGEHGHQLANTCSVSYPASSYDEPYPRPARRRVRRVRDQSPRVRAHHRQGSRGGLVRRADHAGDRALAAPTRRCHPRPSRRLGSARRGSGLRPARLPSYGGRRLDSRRRGYSWLRTGRPIPSAMIPLTAQRVAAPKAAHLVPRRPGPVRFARRDASSHRQDIAISEATRTPPETHAA